MHAVPKRGDIARRLVLLCCVHVPCGKLHRTFQWWSEYVHAVPKRDGVARRLDLLSSVRKAALHGVLS